MNKVKIIKKGKDITIQFQSKSFLQYQVRSMVGCLKYLSCKDWNLKKFKKVFKSKNRKLCAPPAPACGLYLAKIKY
jgi:tRNA pseudouridine38-40 synthase